MKIYDFIKGLDFVEILEEKDNIIKILNKNTQKKYKFNLDRLKYINESDVLDVINGRDNIIMDGVTRIVGYFSKISNWNKSKQGELKDRQKGNYKI